MIDREQAGLRGQVRISRVERDYVHPDQHWVLCTNESFSPDGRLLERLHQNPDGSSWSMIFRYAESRLIEKEHFGTEADAHQLFSYRYDPLGRLERVMLHSPTEGGRVFESLHYAADGTRTSTSYSAPLDDTKRKNVAVCVDSMLHMSTDAVAIMTVFDSNDRPSRKVLYDAGDRVIRRVGFRYDSRGLLLEEGELIVGRIRDDFRNVYQYDALGRQVEVDRRWSGFGRGRRTFAYNQHGDIAQENIEQNSWLIGEQECETWTQRFAYQYDPYGNWTERSTGTVLQNGESRLSMIERRELSYY